MEPVHIHLAGSRAEGGFLLRLYKTGESLLQLCELLSLLLGLYAELVSGAASTVVKIVVSGGQHVASGVPVVS